MPKYKVGDRFNTLELILVRDTHYSFLCRCGNTFNSAFHIWEMTSTNKRCIKCDKEFPREAVSIRPYTEEELAMIEAFNKPI